MKRTKASKGATQGRRKGEPGHEAPTAAPGPGQTVAEVGSATAAAADRAGAGDSRRGTRGGDAEEFKKVQAAYERVLETFDRLGIL
jgi:hypothetical protein